MLLYIIIVLFLLHPVNCCVNSNDVNAYNTMDRQTQTWERRAVMMTTRTRMMMMMMMMMMMRCVESWDVAMLDTLCGGSECTRLEGRRHLQNTWVLKQICAVIVVLPVVVVDCMLIDDDIPGHCKHTPRVVSGVVRIDPLRFLAGCHTRRLNQV